MPTARGSRGNARTWSTASASFSARSNGGGCDYELAIEWRTLLQDEVNVRVVVWDDSWLAFAELADVFAWLATRHGKRVTPAEVCAALLAMGFVDATEREQRR